MKKRPYASAYPMGTGFESRTMMLSFGISLVIHLIFIGSMVYMPDLSSPPRLEQRSIHVNLVSLPGPPKATAGPEIPKASAPVAKPAAVAKEKVKPAPKAAIIEKPPPEPLPAVPKPVKTVSLAPKPYKPKVKRSLKKRTQNRQKMINQALTGVQKNVEKSQADSLRQAFDRLKKKVAQSEATGSQTGQTAAAKSDAAGTGMPGAGGSGPGGGRALQIASLYKFEVALQVERHWAFSHQAAGSDKMLQTKVVFKVLPKGELTDIEFTKHSGNSYLDESVYRAIVKASPVSPHPEGISAPYLVVAVRFTPEGLK